MFMTLAPDIDTFDVTTCNTNTVHNVSIMVYKVDPRV